MNAPAKLLNDAELAALKASIYRVWNDIASDSFSCAYDSGERMDNEAALEGCIDADRLLTNGGDKASNDVVTRICKQRDGYSRLMRLLKKEVHLI